ncbi:FtsX-like permease family protein [bacterium]|nr:FtsX-like permease family protein [bacterium]
MIRFLIKGLIRDRSRSLFPVLTVMVGVMLTVVLQTWFRGVESEGVQIAARFDTGHVKIMSQAYAEEYDQIPNDLAFIGVSDLMQNLRRDFPDMIWLPRIKFGGLLDIPDENGETRAQSPVIGFAVDLLSPDSLERDILNLDHAVSRGRLPEKPGEIVLSDEMARQLGVQINETATLIGSTMYGSLATYNFTVVGTIRFGITVMDRGSMIADLSDIQMALDMDDAAGEILGLFPDLFFYAGRADAIKNRFNAEYEKPEDEFSPIMVTLREQAGFGEILDLVGSVVNIAIGIFVVVMSIVLWNAGLIVSIRRYGEIGVRLAIGEYKNHLYRSLIIESICIGFFGTLLGTTLGITIAYYLQETGINISSMMKNASIVMSDVMRARITPGSFVIGFVPGLLATFLGTSISGIGIYKRQTSRLMKELEV